MNKLRLSIITILMVLTALSARAARERKYIYLFDCTQSMQQYGIWDEARASLDRTLRNHVDEDGNVIAVVPFQEKIYPEITFAAEDYLRGKNKELVDTAFNRYIRLLTNTNIIGAIARGNELIDPTRDNRIYLFTDGEDTAVKAEGVVRALREWCGKYPNTRLFYIMLHRKAMNKAIVEVAEMCGNITVAAPVGGAIPEYIDIDPSDLYTSTLTLNEPLELNVSVDSPLAVKVLCDDPHFTVATRGKAESGRLCLLVSPREECTVNELSAEIEPECDAEGEYSFPIDIVSEDGGVFVLNPRVTVHVANKPLRTMQILGGESEELKAEGAGWYDRFLFLGAARPDTVRIPLQPRFNDAALARGASQSFTVAVPEGQPDDDFTIFAGGREYHTGDRITISTADAPEELLLVFSPGARQGKRYVSLVPSVRMSDVERINKLPVEALAASSGISIRSSYSESWNPLAKILLALGLAIAAGLLVWFVVIRPARYPRFQVGAITIEGPGSLNRRPHIAGCRMLVLTSKPRKQGLLNRIFTRRIVYVINPAWSGDIIIVPASRRKAKVRCPQGWSCTPVSTLSAGSSVQLHSPEGPSSRLSI